MKKNLLAIIVCILAVFIALVGCNGNSATPSSVNNDPVSSSGDGGETESEENVTDKVFEGNMLLNGFDSIGDLYKIKTGQTVTNYNIEETVKYDIVGAEDFLISDSQAKIDKANAALASLPNASSVGAVTNSLRSLASKARSLYSGLTYSGKKQVSGAENLFAILEKAGMNGIYTLGELRQNTCYCGHDLRKGITGASEWYTACADLINLDEGTIAFTASGIYNNWEKSGDMPNHALQVSLFHDNSEKESTAVQDGIYMRFSSQDGLVYVGSATGPATIPLQAQLYSDAVYTVKIGYKVSSDRKKVLISVYMQDEMEQIVCDGSVEIDTLTMTQNFGTQSVENWLTGEDCGKHTGFLIDTGTSAGATVKGLWDGYGFEEIDETDVERDTTDLSPKQGSKALRVKYGQTTLFTYIFARFSASELAGLPVESLGGTSIKVYNDNSETKTITFAIMRDHGVLVELDNATFDLAPHEWTTCELLFDPYVIEEYYDDIVGVTVEFSDRTAATYYLDDWRVSFEQVRTPEQTEKFNIVRSLKSEIDRLDGKQIQTSDAAAVKSVYDNYMSLSPLYKGMLTLEEDKMTRIYTKYIQALAEKDIADGKERFTVLPTDSEYGLLGIEKGLKLPDYATYTTSVKSPNGNGTIRINLASPDLAQGLNVTLADIAYDELHIWVRNDSSNTRSFMFNGVTLYGYRGTAYDESGNEVIGSYVSFENEIVSKNVYDGWIELVYRDYAMIKKITFNSGDGFLYIGGIYGVINYEKVNAMIAALPEYSNGNQYSAAQKAQIEEVRAAYDGLAFINKDEVTNRAKLFRIQAKIWKSTYDGLSIPSNAATAQYNEALDIAVDDLIEKYNGFDDNAKSTINSEYSKLLQLKARYNALADEHRNGIVTLNDLNVWETSMSPWEYNDFKMPEGNANDVFITVFERYNLGWGVFYITLFYEARYGEGGGEGIGIRFDNSEITLSDSYVENTKTYYTIESGMQMYTSYVIKVGYIISNDKSSVEVIVQLADEEAGSIVANAKRTFTSINGYSVKDWTESHDMMSFQSAQCYISTSNSWNSLRVNKLIAVEDLNARINAIEGYSFAQICELKEDYEDLPLIYRMMVKNADIIYQKFDAIIDSYHANSYTLSELGVNDGDVGMWENRVLTLKNEMEGTVVFKMNKIGVSGTQTFSFTLFYDGADAGKGVRMTFQINNNLTINGTLVSMGNVVPNVEYYYLISYKVADDYSKVTVRVRVQTEDAMEVAAGRGVLGDATLELTSLIGAASIENWVKSNKKLLIDAQQCAFSIASAWVTSNVGIFVDLENYRQAIDSLAGDETLSYLYELKDYYDGLPVGVRLSVLEYADKLNDAIDNAYKSIKGENYTLNEFGVADGDIGQWGNRVLTLKNEMEGSVVFKMTKTGVLGSQIHSFTLFYDGADAGKGVRMTFQINNNLTINGTSVSMGNVVPNVEYYYFISYKVAADYSKVTVHIRVQTEDATEVAAGRGVLGDATLELTSLIGADSIENWVKSNKALLIDAQQCAFSIASVWSYADIETFEKVKTLNANIAAQGETDALRTEYNALPFAFKYLVPYFDDLKNPIN